MEVSNALPKKPIEGGYKSIQKGVPTKNPGVTFADLSQAERDAYFIEHENRWKTIYNSRRSTIHSTQQFSKG